MKKNTDRERERYLLQCHGFAFAIPKSLRNVFMSGFDLKCEMHIKVSLTHKLSWTKLICVLVYVLSLILLLSLKRLANIHVNSIFLYLNACVSVMIIASRPFRSILFTGDYLCPEEKLCCFPFASCFDWVFFLSCYVFFFFLPCHLCACTLVEIYSEAPAKMK